jgi:ribosome-associated protein
VSLKEESLARPDDEDRPQYDKPSKSMRKRDAHRLQDLGVELIELRDSELVALDLPEILVEAVREARRTPSRGGGARQRQFIGKLMRDIDPEPIRAALAARTGRSAVEAERFKRLEAWREKLVLDGVTALDELERWRPGLERAEWLRLISAAQSERERGGKGTAGRELFRALRSLFEAEPPP